ncbi:nickel-dependent hydrogenase large subunit [Xanthobacter sp. V3C-3]|uniref:nickel-dependent hydrogenase large subunit n=1 Tax=Xanthobacter lutulentifluminis TaxID=3119935 RepID=UPI0037261F00
MIHAPATLCSLIVAPAGREGPWRVTRETGPDPAQALVGRTADEASRLVPLVFNLCGAAHAAAASAALGLPGRPDTRAMARETMRDHALAILHTWPAALGTAPERATLALLSRPDAAAALGPALVADAGDLGDFSLAALENWLSEAPTATARLLASIRRAVDPAHGRARLLELTIEDVAAALRPPAPHPTSSCAGAQIPAAVNTGMAPEASRAGTMPVPPVMAAARCAPSPLRESGALGRVAHRPLFAALLAQEGASLFVRLLARLVDCLLAIAALASGTDGTARSAAGSPAEGTGFTAPVGVGIAPAARGLLGHGARVEGGRVAAYRILSPSAWNLAPGGLLEQAFATLPSGPDAAWLAPLLVSAINPCVPVTLALAPEAAHA